MRLVNADALAMKLRHMGYMDENEEVQEVIDRFAEECDGDTIYRQEAIDIVEFECGEWTGLAKEISKQLRQLPSAEPEIIHCKYCVNAEERGCALFCGFWSRYTSHKGYCFKAERRTE